MTGTHAGEVPRTLPTGKSFSVRGASIEELRGGKISRHTDYYNLVSSLQQVASLSGISQHQRCRCIGLQPVQPGDGADLRQDGSGTAYRPGWYPEVPTYSNRPHSQLDRIVQTTTCETCASCGASSNSILCNNNMEILCGNSVFLM
jgi:hypothetical protein